ncbi:PP2C family protein-serine/threonine phosphatase [Coprothermobacter platensis]|uniref:PP2C family protein-serine/threonine phosphatase n=1 Tax=Coprothermobacter platensis TaxID=108819 RepID=UPI0003720B76|nr:protein phosphatase 2C domain-containing protein [Coprothermobacter platensis]
MGENGENTSFSLTGWYLTAKGLVRENNEDAILINDDVISNEDMNEPIQFSYIAGNAIFAVADGMGGVGGGEIASRMVLEFLATHWREWKTILDLEKCVKAAHSSLMQYSSSHPDVKGMGTTLAGVWFAEQTSAVFNVGDSRVYALGDNSFLQLSKDQSVVADLVEKGVLTKEQARKHPLRNILTQCIGGVPDKEDLQLVVKVIRPLLGQRFMIFSDGLYDVFSDDELEECFRMEPPRVWRTLLDKYYLDGATDNLSVVDINVLF